jgi:glycerol kinase
VPDDRWNALIDAERCPSIADGRRCQLWKGHSGQPIEHAAAWTDRRDHTPGEPYRTRPTEHWIRWAEGGQAREVPVGGERLPWAAMGRS